MSPTTKRVPTAAGERFNCPCGGAMKLSGLKPRLLIQEWECEDGYQWERDFSQGGPNWRRAAE